MTNQPTPTERLISPQYDALAPDGSEVRLLGELPRGGLAHFRLAPGAVARAVRHATVEEIWYVISGSGRMWRQWLQAPDRAGVTPAVTESEVDLRPGLALTIPVGTAFQFRNTGSDALTVVATTMPPWPGEQEATIVAGPWTPTI